VKHGVNTLNSMKTLYLIAITGKKSSGCTGDAPLLIRMLMDGLRTRTLRMSKERGDQFFCFFFFLFYFIDGGKTMKKLYRNIITGDECLLDDSVDELLITELDNDFDWREWMTI